MLRIVTSASRHPTRPQLLSAPLLLKWIAGCPGAAPEMSAPAALAASAAPGAADVSVLKLFVHAPLSFGALHVFIKGLPDARWAR